MDPGARVDVEPGVPPALHHSDEVTVDLAPGQKHPEDLMPEELLQILQVELRCDPKNTPRAKYAVAAKDVQMRMKAVWKIAEGLHGDHAARDGVGFGNRALEKGLQGLPSLSGSAPPEACGHAGRSDGESWEYS